MKGLPQAKLPTCNISSGKRFTQEDAQTHVDLFRIWAQASSCPTEKMAAYFAGTIEGDAGKVFVTRTLLPMVAESSASSSSGLDPTVVFNAFVKRWPAEVKSRKDRLRDDLFDGKLNQKHNESVTDYIARFKEVLVHCPMSADDQIVHFKRGLSASLRACCAVDAMNRKWTDVHALMQHAIGEEEKMRAANTEHNSGNTLARTYFRRGYTKPRTLNYGQAQERTGKTKRNGKFTGKRTATAANLATAEALRAAVSALQALQSAAASEGSLNAANFQRSVRPKTGPATAAAADNKISWPAPDSARQAALEWFAQEQAQGRRHAEPMKLSDTIRYPNGKPLHMWEVNYYRNRGACFKCFAGRHRASECTAVNA
jgi:hypothetical protein